MNAFRFRPSLEALDHRLVPSATAPAVTIEYLVLAAVPTATHDDVVVDGRIITAESGLLFHPLPKPVRLLETRMGTVDANETITIDGNHTEVPAIQKVRI